MAANSVRCPRFRGESVKGGPPPPFHLRSAKRAAGRRISAGTPTGTMTRRQGNADLRSAPPAAGGRTAQSRLSTSDAPARERRPPVGTAPRSGASGAVLIEQGVRHSRRYGAPSSARVSRSRAMPVGGPHRENWPAAHGTADLWSAQPVPAILRGWRTSFAERASFAAVNKPTRWQRTPFLPAGAIGGKVMKNGPARPTPTFRHAPRSGPSGAVLIGGYPHSRTVTRRQGNADLWSAPPRAAGRAAQS